jgi:predicted flavoprotein YhiN
VSLDVEVRAGKGRFREQILFTHKGLSGPAILQISSYWEPGMDVVINLLPDCDVQAFLDERQGSEQLLSNALAELGWPKRFAEAWLARLGFNVRLKDLSPKKRQLAEQVQHWRIKPNGTQGYKKAEVTRGGVSTKALSSKTMEAKDVPGCFLSAKWWMSPVGWGVQLSVGVVIRLCGGKNC